MKITFGYLLGLIPETQEILIFEGELQLQATCDVMMCWLSDDVMNYEVENIEAEKDLLKVWLKGA